jgi:hypothetical protein
MKNLLYFAIFLAAAGFLGFKGAPYLLGNDGCAAYTQHLNNCTPYQCRQTIKGKRNVYGRYNKHSFKRDIIGSEKDPYLARELCRVLEIDNLSDPKAYDCRYTEKTLKQVSSRSQMLFTPEEVTSTITMDEEQVAHLQLLHMKRIPEQTEECTTLSRQ